MKRITTLLFTLLLTTPSFAKMTIDWWGIAAFRVRNETTKEYTDLWFRGGPGRLNYVIDNSTTRAGYQFGLRFHPRDNLTIGLTLRSGLYGAAQVMLQEITSREGLLPAMQEAYIDWRTPYAKIELGKIPQAGTALWDLYAATLQTDFRADDPRDGIFDDRMASLNGARLSVPVKALNLRGVYHTDYTGGYNWQNKDVAASRAEIRNPDRYVFLLGLDVDGSQLLTEGAGGAILKNSHFSFDYGIPYRAADMVDIDSNYADEKLWGATLKKSCGPVHLTISYAYNWRDSVYTNRFTDALLIGSLYGFKPAVRYQFGKQMHKFGIYDGYEIKRAAWHFYFNRMVWGLEIQPRIILFDNVLAGFRQKKQSRYELTTIVRF